MALVPKDMPITRADVAKWIKTWRKGKKTQTLPDYIRARVDKLALVDPMIDRRGENVSDVDEVHVADMIIEDLISYGVTDAELTGS